MVLGAGVLVFALAGVYYVPVVYVRTARNHIHIYRDIGLHRVPEYRAGRGQRQTTLPVDVAIIFFESLP